MTEYASSGDARRSMALLWGVHEAPTRGPKPGLALADVVAAAVAVADAEGLAALSMRRVAEALGKAPMALYTYVPGKAELLDVMLDSVLGELPTSYDMSAGWRAAVEAWAADGWAFYERHPWVLQVSGSRALLGPHELDAYETSLRLFEGLGFSGVEMSRVVGALSSYVRGAAKAVSDARTAEQVTGVSDDDWWTTRSPLLEEMAGDSWPERYPTITRLSDEQAFDQLDRPDDTTPYTVQDALDSFHFGLALLLDGVAAQVAAKAGAPPGVGR
jgi:AcrR family transcriptional regulator